MYNILKPIQIGSITVKNRIAYLGMGKCLADSENFITDREIAYYVKYAKNDVGMMTTGACIVFPDYPSQLPCQPGLYDDKFIPGIKKLTDAVHQYGAKIFMQPWHPGIANYGCEPEQCKGPADFTVDEIHAIQDQFVQAIVRAQKGGCDGVEWHMAHNYLPEQFAVSLFNKRTDEYGADTIENAARFSAETIRKAKDVCGKDFVISLKINAWDMGFEGGMTPDRCAELCKLLVDAGVELITVSAGGGYTDLTGMSGDGYRDEGWKIDFAETVKKAVNVPVMASGSIRHIDVMEAAISSGKCDMIGMGRGLLAEPEFVKKVQEGRENELRYCLSCMNCFTMGDSSHDELKKHCAMNPTATWEIDEKPLVKDGNGRVVAIIGAGPAGINAAIILAERGFKPVIYDKHIYIGGSVHYAAAPDGKAKLNWAIDYYSAQLKRLDIPVHLNTTATAESIKALNPYAVFVATGATPIHPKSIPGIDGPNVLMALDTLDCIPAYTDETVVVLGSGLVGLEVATTFAHKGCKTTIIDMLSVNEVMAGGMTNIFAFTHAQQAGCVPMLGHKVKEITDHSVIAETQDGQSVEVPATKVIVCLGFREDDSLYKELSSELKNVVVIGNAEGFGNIPKACRNGYDAAIALQ